MPSSLVSARHRTTQVAALLASMFLVACGGGGGGGGEAAPEAGVSVGTPSGNSQTGQTGQTSQTGQAGQTDQSSQAGADTAQAQATGYSVATTRADAYRLLTQATFGATEAEITRTATLGAAGWVDEQLAKPVKLAHQARWDADDAAAKAKDPKATAGIPSMISSFYQQALQADDQLRQRTAFALSEIFVVSTNEILGERVRAVASYHDMLTRNAFGNFRTLLQDVAMHPAMGLYLSHMRNRKEDVLTGRVPDQNFAREIMQLFSIGLVQLNSDGTPKLDGNGAPIDTYGVADIEGLSSVFTGFSWYGPDTQSARFGGTLADPNRLVMPMQGYPQFHSTLAKSFLGTTVAPQSPANPSASLQAAIDTLFAHPNVGPFISRQLIQRLVTSSPSPAYVGRVAAVFNNNGSGVRGDMKAVVRAILLDDEARSPTVAAGPQYGKLREPVLRLTAFLRAYAAKSDSGKVLMIYTDDPGQSLAQTPLRSPSVFNFFRPGYVPAGGEAAAAGMTLPEMQITNETSVAGYANFMLAAVWRGVGQKGIDGKAARCDLQPNYGALRTVAADSGALVDQVNTKLFGSSAVNATLRSEMVAAIDSITVPVLKPDGSNQTQIDKAKASRVWAATSLALVSPEFIVQK